ncbi:peptide chain release factor N(5)-glutamine methyltransferase [Planktothrix sp. FACHB-1355]|uniref:peptide chain release factor N(5)-glutamine methyltransferase n=1 Tax=Planktothrix sp. FACHB-1355 TaxID=2692854 RepID=UPI00168C031D|nr:peptide chain release factor N(5)-glutamine methyltransferase [Planktothrix sp. FACHB-1355]MBD3563048.1 peptide chain release factor N(5)-glutamine methyltransferase [Planktothrix sp. FACHB-1355]
MADDRSVSGLELWRWRQNALAAAKAADVPLTEVDWMLQEVAGLDRLTLRLESYKDWPKIKLKLPLPELNQLWQRRLQERLPVQYVTGIAPWRHFKLKVSPAVLIPRPETECLIDLAIASVKRPDYSSNSYYPALPLSRSPALPHWADLGTGSGAIAIGLADAFPDATIHAVDKSAAALDIARENAQTLGFANRINFYRGSWFEPLEHLKGKLSGMISNPPYIPREMLPSLQAEVTKHEPHLALDGGIDGLDCIRHLVEKAPEYLRPGGLWLIEMMAGQADAVAELLERQGSYCEIQIFSDLEGVNRFALAYRC